MGWVVGAARSDQRRGRAYATHTAQTEHAVANLRAGKIVSAQVGSRSKVAKRLQVSALPNGEFCRGNFRRGPFRPIARAFVTPAGDRQWFQPEDKAFGRRCRTRRASERGLLTAKWPAVGSSPWGVEAYGLIRLFPTGRCSKAGRLGP